MKLVITPKNTIRMLIPALLMTAGNLNAEQSEDKQNEQTAALEKIVVTARKVKEEQQDVPVSMVTFTADALERRQIVSTDDIGKVVPNLNFSSNAPLTGNNTSSIIFIRGVGQISGRANTDPGVGLYIDDVYMGQSVGGSIEMRDIDNVQVLRGPQGTLFGRNTIGGAVLLTTTEAGDTFGGTFRVGLGDDNLFEMFAAVDAPISDTVFSRFTVGTKKQDGYVARLFDGTDLGDVNNTTVTARFRFEPSDSFTARLNFDYTAADENGSPMVFAAYSNNTDFNDTGPSAGVGWFSANASVGAGCPDAWIALPGPPGRPVETAPGSTLDVSGLLTVGGGPRGYVGENNDPRCVNNQWNAGPFANNGTHPLSSELDNWGMSLIMEWELDKEISFKSISSYRSLDWYGSRDADNTPFVLLHTDFDSSGDQFTQEFQYNYQGDGLTAVAGVYYYTEEIDDILTVFVGDAGPGSSCGPGTDRCHLDSNNNITDNQSLALYGKLIYELTPDLSASAGFRHTSEQKANIPDQFNYANPDNKYLPVQRYQADFSATTFSGELGYRVNDSNLIYLSYSEGFKGGGWNSTFNYPLTESDLEAGHRFDQEEVSTIETGFKSDINANFRLNGAIFSSDYTDLQFTYRVFIAPWFFNAGKASIDGAELEFTWVPDERWILEGGVGYLDSSIDETANIVVPGRPVNTSVAAGNKLPFAPDLSWNLGIGYDMEAGDFHILPRVDISYSDAVYFDAANTALISQTDSYTVVDFSVGIEPVDADWKVTVGLNNATDELYRISGNSSLGTGSGYGETAYARPRVAFFNFSYDFY